MKTGYICLLVAGMLFVGGCNEGVMQTAKLGEGITFDIWPAGYLDADAANRGEKEHIEKNDIYHLNNVTLPSMTVYKAKGDGPRAAVMICPGGGYNILAIDLEGTEIAQWLNSQGITAAILRYRVPGNPQGAFADGQRGMSILRFRADEFNIDPGNIGVIGFSAGGNLSGKLCTNFDDRQYAPVDANDNASCRPDFAMLVYPYLQDNNERDGGLAADIKVTKDTPPAIMIHAQDDWVKAESSILYYRALRAADVPAELHLFPTGGHGYGLRPRAEHAISIWPELCNVWLKGFTTNSTN